MTALSQTPCTSKYHQEKEWICPVPDAWCDVDPGLSHGSYASPTLCVPTLLSQLSPAEDRELLDTLPVWGIRRLPQTSLNTS